MRKRERWKKAVIFLGWGFYLIGQSAVMVRGTDTQEILTVTAAPTEIPTESPTPTTTPAATPTPEVTPIPEEDKQEMKIHLGLDTKNVYENMEVSFSQGYLPVVEDDVVHLTVPFTASGELKDQKVTVDLDLGTGGPFIYASYRKQVEKQNFTFEQQQIETYLYQCDIQLEKERKNGVYPVIVKAVGYTENGKAVKLEYRIFVTITDGKDPAEEQSQEEISQEDSLSMDEGGEMETFPGGMSGETDWEEVVHQPKMILTANSLNQERIVAGDKKEIKLTLKNSSREEKICNLKITGKAAEDTVSLETSSFYFESVPPQETIEVATAVFTAPVAEQKGIPVEFTLEYENDQGTSYTGTEQITIFISQPAQAVMEGFDLPDHIVSLENLTAGLQIRNVGKAPIYNVKAELQAEGLFPMETIFAGNMEAGQSFDGTMKVYVGNKKMKIAGEETEGSDGEKYGTSNGKLVLTYEDAFGKTYVSEQKVSTVIQKPQITELKVEKEKEETNQWWAVSLVLLILLGSAIVTAMGWKLKKNKDLLADLRAKEEIREAETL